MSTTYQAKLYYGVSQDDLIIHDHEIKEDMDREGFHWLRYDDSFIFAIEMQTTSTSFAICNIQARLVEAHNDFEKLQDLYDGKITVKVGPDVILFLDAY